MPDRSRRRAGTARLIGRRRAQELSTRLGTAVKLARRASTLRQSDVADRAGVAQSFISRIERGDGRAASLETWAAVASAMGFQLAAFIERAPGTSLPRDYEHLKRQRLILETAARGGWTGTAEHAIDPDWTRPRSIDVVLRRRSRNETAVVEIWDWLDDVGAAFRALDAKVTAMRREGDGVVSGLMVVRGTRRNRQLVSEFRTLFAARFTASSAAWLRALTDTAPMPVAPGLLWTDVGGAELRVARV
jgi:transcriptional regulator with XRE-family HTH domain